MYKVKVYNSLSLESLHSLVKINRLSDFDVIKRNQKYN